MCQIFYGRRGVIDLVSISKVVDVGRAIRAANGLGDFDFLDAIETSRDFFLEQVLFVKIELD